MRSMLGALVALTMWSGVAAAAERPAPPQIALPEAPSANVCEAPDTRSAFLAEFEGRMDEVLAYGQTANRYSSALAEWKSQQMIERGLWTRDESSDFAISLLGDEQFMQHFETSMGGVMNMISSLQAVEQATEETERCAHALSALNTIRGVLQSTEAQWAYLDEAYNAEARRRGGAIE